MTKLVSRSVFYVFVIALYGCASTPTETVSNDQDYSRALNALNTETIMQEGRPVPMSPEVDVEPIKDHLKRSLDAYREERFSEAEALYYQAEELGANDETILFWLGNYSLIAGDIESARHYYEDLLRINPANAKALYNLATVYLSKAENYFQFYTASVPEENVEQELLRLMGSIDRFSDASQREVDEVDQSPLDSLRQLLER